MDNLIGKNLKFAFYMRGVLRELVSGAAMRGRAARAREMVVAPSVRRRVAYCCKIENARLPDDAPRLRDLAFPRKGSAYWFDARELTRCFDGNLRWLHEFGDVTTVPREPSIVKSRPIAGDNANAVLLPLNKVRHFVFADDKTPFAQKRDTAVFRGVVKGRAKRKTLFEKHFGNPLCDLGDTSRHPIDAEEWRTAKMSVAEQLQYKFVLAIEGNDVASNLKWVMSSNSLAVMPPPEFETWFMEGTLRADVDYVAVAPDYSDLDEKIRFYASHPDAAEKILENAHRHTAEFRNPAREFQTAILTLDRYFKETGQG